MLFRRFSILCCMAVLMLPTHTQAVDSSSEPLIPSAVCSDAIQLVDSNDNLQVDLVSEFTAALQTLGDHLNLTCMTLGSNYTAQVAEAAYTELLAVASSMTTTETSEGNTTLSYSEMACQSLESVLKATCLWPVVTVNPTESPTLAPTLAPTDSPTMSPTLAPTPRKEEKPKPGDDKAPTENSTDTSSGSNGSSNVNGTTNESTTSQESGTEDRYRSLAIILGAMAGALVLLVLVIAAWKPCRSNKTLSDEDSGTEVALGIESLPFPEIQEYEWSDDDADEEQPQETMNVPEEVVNDTDHSGVEADTGEVLFVASPSTRKEPQEMGRGEIVVGSRSFQIVIQEASEEQT